MRRASCLLRISAGQVQGVWEGAGRSGSQRLEAAADFSTSENAPTLRDAVDAVLAAILPFAKLPKAQEDRRLVISQRFCREHRLEAGKVEVVGSPLHGPKTASPKTESGRSMVKVASRRRGPSALIRCSAARPMNSPLPSATRAPRPAS